MKILFLDDMKIRHDAFRQSHVGHEVIHVETADQAKAELDKTIFDIASLDHDLAEEHYLPMSQGVSENRLPGDTEYKPGTGMDVVDHIVKMDSEKRPKYVVVHSFNERGQEMLNRLKAAGVPSVWVRFNPKLRYVP